MMAAAGATLIRGASIVTMDRQGDLHGDILIKGDTIAEIAPSIAHGSAQVVEAHGVSMPAAAATRESVARMVGRGHEDVDFAVLLLETARVAGLELKPENVKIDDGLAA